MAECDGSYAPRLKEAEQQVLRADEVMAELPSLVVRHNEAPAGPVGESFEHETSIEPLSSPYQIVGSSTVANQDPDGDLPLGDGKLEPTGVDWDDVLAQLARQPQEEGWLTLDEASEAAGVSRSTLRSWYRNGQIPSRMVAGVHGPQRLVPLEAVVSRALRSARARRQLEHARSVEAEVAELRRRVETLERHLGLL